MFCIIMKDISQGIHPHGVWWDAGSLRPGHFLAVICGIFMRLEEGHLKLHDKCGSKVRIAGRKDQAFQERKVCGFHGRKQARPLLFVCFPKAEPMIKLIACNRKAFTQTFHTEHPGKVFRENTQDEKQAVTGVRNDEIRKDSMGMAAGADDTQDADLMTYRPAIYKVHKGTPITGMHTAGTSGATERTGLQFGTESVHEGIKQEF